MSHFSVAILTKGQPSNEKIDDILGIYCEDVDVSCCYGSVEWVDKTDRICQDWEEAPEDIKQQYPTLIKYATQYYGCSRIPGKSNSFGYLTNPKSKWDWYQIGGGWQER